MYVITCASIRAARSCYDPTRYLAEDYSESLQTLLADARIPAVDRVWVAVRHLNDKDRRIFAVFCARQALAHIAKPDPRSIAVCDIAERFAYGNATYEELQAARAAAATVVAAATTAYAAAYVADHTTHSAAAGLAAAAAATTAAAYAAAYAADHAADSAADAAATAAAYAAQTAEREKQCNWLIDYLNGGHSCNA